MPLTPAQKHLVKWLKLMKCSEDEAVGIMLLLDTPAYRDEMMQWMTKHPDATPSDLIGNALAITKRCDELSNSSLGCCSDKGFPTD